jgi:hypothetical protein
MIHQLVQLAYVSRAAALETSARSELLKQARTDNARRQLTGMLISLGDIYVQALEGERSMVEAVFHTIARDERHSQVTQLFLRPISERMFTPWKMGYWDGRSHTPMPRSIEDITAAAAEQLLRHARSSMTLARRTAADRPPRRALAKYVFGPPSDGHLQNCTLHGKVHRR